QKFALDEPTPEPSVAVPERAAQWPRRPRIVQFNAGRIEMSMPYQIAIAFLLGIILLVLLVFRLGQYYQRIADSAVKIQKNNLDTPPGQKEPTGRGQTTDKGEKISPGGEKVEAVKSKGNNRIVIQTYQIRADLEPVKQHFARFDIETEIRRINEVYYLVTEEKYENPKRLGTDGYLARQKIIAVGAEYKAQQGYETFAPHFFKDAYGMKFDD
ncbi:unnamed protein product, partial [marine sediment metagenome]